MRNYCHYCLKTLDPDDRDPLLRSFVKCTRCGRIFHEVCYTKHPQCSVCGCTLLQSVHLTEALPPLKLSERTAIDIRDELTHQVQKQRHLPILYVAVASILAIAVLLGLSFLVVESNLNSSSVRTVKSDITTNRSTPIVKSPTLSSQIISLIPTTLATDIPLPLQIVPTTVLAGTFIAQIPVPTTQSTQTPSASATQREHPTSTVQTTISGIVTANHLNLRSGPGPEYDDLGTLNNGALVVLVGRNANGTWGQLNSSEWINAQYVSINGSIDILPITFHEVGSWGSAGMFIGVRGRADDVLRIRGGPGVNYVQLSNPDTIKAGTIMDIVGRSADGNWYQINVDRRSGWVNARYTTIIQGTASDLPVTT